MESIIDLVISSGIGVACIIYFMVRDYKFMDTMQTTLSSVRDSLDIIKQFLIDEEKKQ